MQLSFYINYATRGFRSTTMCIHTCAHTHTHQRSKNNLSTSNGILTAINTVISTIRVWHTILARVHQPHMEQDPEVIHTYLRTTGPERGILGRTRTRPTPIPKNSIQSRCVCMHSAVYIYIYIHTYKWICSVHESTPPSLYQALAKAGDQEESGYPKA